MKKLSAGDEIDAWCTKCKMDLGHRIVALVENTPKRVVCLTCDSTHNYRAPKDGPSFTGAKPARKAASSSAGGAKKPRAGSAAARAEADRLKAWETRVLGQTATAFKRYTISTEFSLDDLVLHKKFGEGYVVEVSDDGKVVVMFRDQQRILVHART